MNKFDRLNDWIRNTESSVVNVISAIAPWLAPLAPAYMTFEHARTTLGFPLWIAVPGAVTVEILGFSTVSTFLAFWFYNRKNQAEAKKAPIALVVFSFVFYLALILVSNVILDWFDNAKWAVIVVRALFTLQSIPAALIVATRTQHRDMLAAIEKDKANKANRTNGTRTDALESAQGTNKARTYSNLDRSEKYFIANADTADAARELNVTPRAIQKWKKRVTEEISQGKL